MSVELILLALSPIFWLCIGYEFIKHRKRYDINDSLANTALAIMHQGADALSLILLMPLFYWLFEYRLFDIEFNLVTVIGVFVLQDFLYYWFHRASHNVHWLWAAHVVHHSSTIMNFSTAFRQSLMYPVAGMWLFWTPMMLLGFDPKVVLMVVACNLAFQFFVHTEIIGKLGWLETIFNTPSHHRVHHAINPGYIDRNFAGVLIIWDKMFGTFVEEERSKACQYGIIGQINSYNPIKISFHQWLHMFEQVLEGKTLTEKAKAIFGYPTSSEAVKNKAEPAEQMSQLN